MTYEMGGTILSITENEKDLEGTMSANMKVSEQCIIAASKGNQVLGMIRSGHRDILELLCKSHHSFHVLVSHHEISSSNKFGC